MPKIRILLTQSALCFVSACSGHQTHSYVADSALTHTDPAHVVVLMSDPVEPFTKIGSVSAKRGKVGFSDPTVDDAREQLQLAGAEVGADAVIVRNSHSDGHRIVYVEGEAIRYTKH
jgi:hypothetical protein